MTALERLSCFACGTVDHTVPSSSAAAADKEPINNSSNHSNSQHAMMRASISRRAEHMESPQPRARSQERWASDDTEKQDRDNRSPSPTTTTTTTTTTTSSQSSAASSNRAQQQRHGHQRAMSDPFDAQEADQDDLKQQQQQQKKHSKHHNATHPAARAQPIPTLPRYPVSANRNRNCWSEPMVDIFKVRSKQYFDNGRQKITSGPFLMEARGCDLLLLNGHKDCDDDMGSSGVSMIQDKLHMILEGRLRSEPTLAINFQFPWGVMMLYWHVPQSLAPYMVPTPIPIDTAKLSIPEQTLAKWLMGDDDYRNERLKLIPFVAEGPWVVRKLVTGTPAIIGKKLPVEHLLFPASTSANPHQHVQQPLLMSTLDIGSGSATAKRIVSVCRRYMSALTVDIGLVIQGDSADELPEQMLGSIRIHGPDPLKALHIER